MKRTLLTGMAVALVLGGCATGETGHLDPEITPDLVGPRSTQEPVPTAGASEEDEGVETPAPGASAAPTNDVEAAFAASSGSQTWYADVQAVDIDGFMVLVSTSLELGDTDAVEVCEAAFAAAQETGIATPEVDVRDSEGQSISQRDAAAGEQGCSSGMPEPTATEGTTD